MTSIQAPRIDHWWVSPMNRGIARAAAHVWLPQREEADCGLAALAMVGLRLGVQVSVDQLRQRTAPGPDGLSLQQLSVLAEQIGLRSRAVRVSADRLGQVKLPALAHLRGGHSVVLHELTEHGVVIADPASGIVTWNMDFLSQVYSGLLLLFTWPSSQSAGEPGPQ